MKKIDEFLKQENGKALVLQLELNKLIDKRDKLNNLIEVKHNELRNTCIHNEKTVEDSYISGGYLDREEYIKTTTCDVCGKILDRKVKYGGFG